MWHGASFTAVTLKGNHMTKRLTWMVLGLVLAGVVAVEARAQMTPAPSDPTTLDAVVEEMRMLRRAIEKQGVTAARTQLLMGRLALQDQRLNRARQATLRAEEDVSSAERERNELQTLTREVARTLDQVTDESQRQDLEQRSRLLKARLADRDAEVEKIEARLAQARQALAAETARYDELEASFNDLDRQLQRSGS